MRAEANEHRRPAGGPLWAVGLAVSAAVLVVSLAAEDAGGWVRRGAGLLVGREGDGAALAVAAGAVVWVGLTSTWIALQLLKRPLLALGLPVWAGAVAASTWVGVRLATGRGLAGPETPATFGALAAGSGAVLVVMLASGAVGAPARLRGARVPACLLLLLLVGLPWLVLGRWVLAGSETVGGEPGGLLRAAPVPGDLMLAGGLAVAALAAAALAEGAARGRAGMAAWAGAATAVWAVAGWIVLNLAVAPRGDEVGVPAARLVAMDGADEAGLVYGWSLAQAAAAACLACGAWAALRLAGPGPETESPPALVDASTETEGPGARQRVYGGFLVVYLALVVYGSLVPVDYEPVSLGEAAARFMGARYMDLPVKRRADIVANLVLYVPLAFLAMGAIVRDRRRAGRGVPAAAVVAGGWLVALAVEFVQVYFPPRTVSLNDLAAEAIGTVLGVGLWMLVGERVTQWVRGLWHERDRRRRAIHVLAGYVVALALYQLFPYDLVVAKEELVRKLELGRLHLAPLTDLRPSLACMAMIEVAALAPVGYLAATVWWRRWRPIPAAVAAGFVFTLVGEGLQVFVYSRYAATTDVLLGTAGAGLGGWLATHFGPAAVEPYPRTWPWRGLAYAARLAVVVALAVAILWVKWQPLGFEWPEEGARARLVAVARVPFYHQYWSSEFEATVQLLRDVGAVVVLGLMLASVAGGGTWLGRMAAGATAAVYGAGIEAGRVCFPPQEADLTTAVLMAAGGVAGAMLYRPFVRTFIERPEPEPEAAFAST